MAENGPKHVSEPPTPPARVKEDAARLANGGQDRTDRASTTSGGTVVLSDDMLYKLSKKIAQLTKVIYSLNTKNDDLELEMEKQRQEYEEKLQKSLSEPPMDKPGTSSTVKENGLDVKKELSADGELKKELRRTKHQLKQYEMRIKILEEEQASSLSTPQETDELALKFDQERVLLIQKFEEEKAKLEQHFLLERQQIEQQVNIERHQFQIDRHELETQLQRDRQQLESELQHLGQQIDLERQQLEQEKHQLFVEMDQEKEVLLRQLEYDRQQLLLQQEQEKEHQVADVQEEREHFKRSIHTLETKLSKCTSENQVLTQEVHSLRHLQESRESSELSRDEESRRIISNLTQEKEELKKCFNELFSEKEVMSCERENLKSEVDMVFKNLTDTRSKVERVEVDLQSSLAECTTLKLEKQQMEQGLTDTREYFQGKIEDMVEETRIQTENYDKMKTQYETEIRHFQNLANTRENELGELKGEVMLIKENLVAQEPKHRQAIQELSEKLRSREQDCRRLEGELAVFQLTAQTTSEEVRTLTEQLNKQKQVATTKDKELVQSKELAVRLQRDMGQANEKLAGIDDKFKVIEVERDGLRKKVKESDIKIEMLNKKQKEDKSKDQNVKDLEKALEEALIEREQILEACEKEIEQERNIAIELEQKMLEDFEWKLREVEGGYKQKISQLEESVDTRLREQQREINRNKDGELTKMCIDARRDMETKLKNERESLRAQLTAAFASEKEEAVKTLTLQKDREIRMLQRSWEEERSRFDIENKRLKTMIDQEVNKQVNRIRGECDQKIFDLQRKHGNMTEKYQHEFDAMKEKLDGELNRLRAEMEEKKDEYELKISDLMSGKVDNIFKMKEEVESEFSDRMTGLRDIYRQEINQQTEKHNLDITKWKDMERCFNLKLEEKATENKDNITYYTQRESELEAKIDELMTRLQEQTAAYMKLQTEFDNYDWWEEDEEEGGGAVDEDGAAATDDKNVIKKSKDSVHNRSRPPTRPPTREDVIERLHAQPFRSPVQPRATTSSPTTSTASHQDKDGFVVSNGGVVECDNTSARVAGGSGGGDGSGKGGGEVGDRVSVVGSADGTDGSATSSQEELRKRINSTSSGKSSKKLNCAQQ